MPEETIALRDAARQLTFAKNPKARRSAERDLLGVLRSGALKAGFYILEGTTWIEIPLAHWETTDGNRLRSLHRRKGDPKSGTYKVPADKFPEQFAKIIRKTEENAKGRQASDLGRDMITAAAERYEVVVKPTISGVFKAE